MSHKPHKTSIVSQHKGHKVYLFLDTWPGGSPFDAFHLSALVFIDHIHIYVFNALGALENQFPTYSQINKQNAVKTLFFPDRNRFRIMPLRDGPSSTSLELCFGGSADFCILPVVPQMSVSPQNATIVHQGC